MNEGAFALAFHGHPRFTGDIDFWINNDPLNAERVFNNIKDFGFPTTDISEKDFMFSDLIFQIGYPPVRIDFITSVSVLTFDKSFKNKKIKKSGGLKIYFISIEDLKKNKKASCSKKDLIVLEELRKHK